MHRFLFRSLKRKDREGQGLVEYALILVLVAIIVIAVVALFGQTLTNTYCTITYTFGTSQKTRACKNPIITCKVINSSAMGFSMEITGIDPDSAPGATPDQMIDRILFYVGDSVVHTENFSRFCYPGSPPSASGGEAANCLAVTTTTQANQIRGQTIRAVAYDADGNTGTCSVQVGN